MTISGNTEIVSFLLEKGATVDPRNRNGSTPLSLAALRGILKFIYNQYF